MKLRESSGRSGGTLIYYNRPDEAGSRYSEYTLVPVEDANGLREILSAAVGVLVVVEKAREVFLYGSTRIHLDSVRELGAFVELETVVGEQGEEEVHAEHEAVRVALGLHDGEVVPSSYGDLCLSKEKRP